MTVKVTSCAGHSPDLWSIRHKLILSAGGVTAPSSSLLRTPVDWDVCNGSVFDENTNNNLPRSLTQSVLRVKMPEIRGVQVARWCFLPHTNGSNKISICGCSLSVKSRLTLNMEVNTLNGGECALALLHPVCTWTLVWLYAHHSVCILAFDQCEPRHT